MAEQQDVSHSPKLVEKLDYQRETENLTDVVLICGGKVFPAHKNVLCAANKFFEVLFTPRWEENGRERIELPSVSAEEMDIVLPFLYTGKIKDFDNPLLLRKLLTTTDMLQIKGLFEYCYKKLCDELTSNDFLEIFNLAVKYSDEGMMMLFVKFMSLNFTVVTTSEEFLKLGPCQLKIIVHHLDSCKFSTDDLVKGLLQWTEFEPGREDTLLNILTSLDLRKVSTDLLMELLRERTSVKKNYHVLTLLTAESTTRVLARQSKNLQNSNEHKLLCFGKNDQRQIFRMYDVQHNCWSQPKIIPFQLEYGMSTVWYRGYVYVLGGGEIGNSRPLAKVIKYSPASNTVVSTRTLLHPVYQAGIGILDDFIYVVTGLNENSQAVRTVQRYNPMKNTCEMVASTIKPHNRPHVFGFSDYLIAVGSYQEQNIVERYDAKPNQWTEVTSVPGAIEWCSATIYEGQLYVVPSRETNTLQVYDFDSDTWVQKVIANFPDEVFGLYVTILKGKSVLLVRDDDKTLHLYDDDSEKWIGRSETNTESWNVWQTCAI